jgi:hypothetical protein
MHKIANVCVDAGMIMVGDLGYLDTVDKKADPGSQHLGRVFDIENGVHDVKWRIKNSWNGDVGGQQTIEIKSGKLFICDPCYIIGKTHESWAKWLDDTAFGKNIDHDGVFIIDNTGGDGQFKVELDIDED